MYKTYRTLTLPNRKEMNKWKNERREKRKEKKRKDIKVWSFRAKRKPKSFAP